jgi:hypothetical protein
VGHRSRADGLSVWTRGVGLFVAVVSVGMLAGCGSSLRSADAGATTGAKARSALTTRGSAGLTAPAPSAHPRSSSSRRPVGQTQTQKGSVSTFSRLAHADAISPAARASGRQMIAAPTIRSLRPAGARSVRIVLTVPRRHRAWTAYRLSVVARGVGVRSFGLSNRRLSRGGRYAIVIHRLTGCGPYWAESDLYARTRSGHWLQSERVTRGHLTR